MRKGQLFSLDFLLALVITVLAIGMMLDFYETGTYEKKEAEVQAELREVMLGAGNAINGIAKCNPVGQRTGVRFDEQAYMIYGCISEGALGAMSEADLLIPEGFNCYIALGGIPITECSEDAPGSVENVAAFSRQVLVKDGGIGKNDYEKCMEQSCSGVYREKELLVKVWKA